MLLQQLASEQGASWKDSPLRGPCTYNRTSEGRTILLRAGCESCPPQMGQLLSAQHHPTQNMYTYHIPILYMHMYVRTYTWHIHTYIHTYIDTHTKHNITLHYIALHYTTLHYITLHYITSHHIALHYIHTHKQKHIHTYIYILSVYTCTYVNILL